MSTTTARHEFQRRALRRVSQEDSKTSALDQQAKSIPFVVLPDPQG
jgi:hypothetical protein